MNYDSFKYERYMTTNHQSRWATIEEIQKSGTFVDLGKEGKSDCGGIPLISDGEKVYVDGKDTHTLIFGATGSKKTRLFCMPAINLFIKAGESFVATDPKGELYEKTSGFAKSEGYNIVVLNFRDIGHGDMWNPLKVPYELYRAGDTEAAMSMINDFVSTISEPQRQNTNDIFWPEMASAFALANILLLFESADENEVNVGSLSALGHLKNEELLSSLSKQMSDESVAGMNYGGVFSGAEKTRQSIYATLYGMLRVFNTQTNLTRMLSGNTIDIKKFGREKTAVYIIVPDEKTTYHFLVTTFIKQAYEILVNEAQKEKDIRLPVRVNFVLDEFCNIPKVPDMPAMISAARSRNMRYFLVAQSLHQLKGKYGEDADTIKGNCDNWVFLTSKELDLLEEISALCGTVSGSGNEGRPLISVSELQRLDKEKGEALIIHARQYPIITEIADIDMYKAFKGFSSAEQKPFDLPPLSLFSLEKMMNDIREGKREIPFAKEDAAIGNVSSQPVLDIDELNEFLKMTKKLFAEDNG